MTASRHLPAMVAAVLLAGSGVVHGVWTERWAADETAHRAAEALDRMPSSVGDWVGEEAALSEPEVRFAELAGYALRHYRHVPTNRTITVLVMCGDPGPISVHPPTACYKGAGYRIAGNVRRCSISSSMSDNRFVRDTFQVADFRKPPSAGFGQVRIFWAWSADGQWTAPDNPRLAFAGAPALFKLYVTSEMDNASKPDEKSTAEAFLQQLLPQLRTTVFAPSP